MKKGIVQFGRIPYAAMEAGVFAVMTGGQAKVYSVLAAHGDKSFKARPSVDRLCAKSGLKRRAVQNALRGLAAKGCIEVTAAGGGRGRTTAYRLCTKGAWESALSRKKKAHAGDIKGAPAGEETAHGDAEKGAAPCAPTEMDREREQTTTGTAAPGLGPCPAPDVQQRNLGILRRIGLGGNGALERLANTPGLTPLAIVGLLAEGEAQARNLPGWIRRRIEAGILPTAARPDPKALCAAIQNRYVVRVGPWRFDDGKTSAKWNDQGLLVLREGQSAGRVPAAELGSAEIE